jgi:hypothetical protein
MMKIRIVPMAAMVVASAMAVVLACGGKVAEGPEAGDIRDGSSPDRESDHAMAAETAQRPDVTPPSDGGCGESICFDAFLPLPIDAEFLDGGCYPYVCSVGELCVTLVLSDPSSTPESTWCADVPQGCGQTHPSVTCECLEQSSMPWCVRPACTIDAGQIVLTCVDQPPP